MHRTATKARTRKRRALRPERRPKAGRRPATAAVATFDRPANDTNIDDIDFAAEPEFAPEAELDSVGASLAVESETVVVPDLDETPLPEVMRAEPTADPSTELGMVAEAEPDEADESEDDDDEESQLAADTDEEAAASGSGKPEEPQSFLAMYFRDMAELSVLKPEQEFETARQIEELEIDLWKALLCYAPWAAHLVATVESAMGCALEDVKPYCLLSERLARKGSPIEKKRLAKLVSALAPRIKELDIDRVFVDAALTELQRLSAAARLQRQVDGLGFSIETKSFQDFAHAITRKSGVVKRAKNEFVKANLRLVVSIARRFNHGRLPLPDLIQEGNIGLMKAVERYDYRRGFRFSTYASWWIRHAISRALADKGRAVRLPVHMIDAYHRIAKSERELQSKLERPATTEEIASVTGIEAEKLEKMRTFLADNPVSLDRSLSEDDGRRLIDVLVDPNEAPSPPEQMMSSETQQEMLKLLGVLKPIEADILRKRFGLINDHERTLKEIGDEYRLSRERVRQLQEQALGKMRKAMAKRDIL
ncbi:MAG: sigma-70 family RNA polymerase sigma factor [Polyangia bacterium]